MLGLPHDMWTQIFEKMEKENEELFLYPFRKITVNQPQMTLLTKETRPDFLSLAISILCSKSSIIPNNLSIFSNLQRLDVAGNPTWKKFPAGIEKLINLKELYVARCELTSTSFPQELSHLTKLQVFDISGNKFSHGLSPVIGKVMTLTALNAVECHLRFLPQELSHLSKLKELDISRNEFSQGLPPFIGQLTALTSLSAYECTLISLPDELSYLSNLKELYVSDNNFSQVPSVLKQLPTCTKVRI